MRLVALADVGEWSDNGLTAGEVLAERLDLAHSWHRAARRRAELGVWLERLNTALTLGPRAEVVAAGTPMSSLSAVARAAVLVAAALAERPRIVFADLGGGLPADPDGRDLPTILAALAPAATTLVLGSTAGEPGSPGDYGARGVQAITLDRKALQR